MSATALALATTVTIAAQNRAPKRPGKSNGIDPQIALEGGDGIQTTVSVGHIV